MGRSFWAFGEVLSGEHSTITGRCLDPTLGRPGHCQDFDLSLTGLKEIDVERDAQSRLGATWAKFAQTGTAETELAVGGFDSR
jgi:hypothetical protein